jgi:hypothetical protein
VAISQRLFVEASILYKVVYKDRAKKPCGQCEACRREGQTSPSRKFTFVWSVAGDILTHLKVHNRALKYDGGTSAGLAVDEGRALGLLARARSKACGGPIAERAQAQEPEDEGREASLLDEERRNGER